VTPGPLCSFSDVGRSSAFQGFNITPIAPRSASCNGVDDNTERVGLELLKKKGELNEAGSDTAESTSIDDDEEEFNTGMNSFDFSDNGKQEASYEEDGFKVIDSPAQISGFEEQHEEEVLCDDEKSVKSSCSMMSTKAKEWRNKIEEKKRSQSSQRAEIPFEEPNHGHSNIFVSAGDDNSTIEFREKPKILHVDEDDTLFDFGNEQSVLQPAILPKPVEKRSEKYEKVRIKKERKNSSRGRRSRHSPVVSDDMSEITTPTVGLNKQDSTFFDRLQSCTTEAVGRCEDGRRGSGLPTAHLQFMRNATTDVNGTSRTQDNRGGGLMNMLTSTALCGSSETVEEPEYEKPQRKSRGNFASNYLEAINSGKATSSSSVVSSSSTQSATWQRFLDKRNAALSSKRSSTTDVSKAAREYAAQKVNEIANRGNYENSKRSLRPPSSSESRTLGSKPSFSRRRANLTPEEMMSKRDAAKAAEDLAAARVEAMMAMTPRTLSHDEAEI
jgi:hypothetical protein